jgi:hypothetical protein
LFQHPATVGARFARAKHLAFRAATEPESWITGGELERLEQAGGDGFVGGRLETIKLTMKSTLENNTRGHYIWGLIAPQALDIAYQP